MTAQRNWIWVLAPVLLSAGVLWLSAQEGKPQAPAEGVKVGELAEKLQARERVLGQKEAQLRELEQRLATLQTGLDKDRQDLQAREKALQDARTKFEAERTRPAIDPQLLQTYQAMEAGSGAQALKELHLVNPDMAVGLLGSLPPKKAAKVLEALGQTDAKLMGKLLEKVGSTKPRA
jgi:flagellar motility protein MotE (MotC chaperone)